MTSTVSLWGSVAERYSQARDLRAGDLAGRFTARFEAGTLVIRKSTGVERRVDFDEFRAAWRTLATGGSDDTLRLVTANAPYLRSVRDDLIASGVPAESEATPIDADDINTAERLLLLEAGRRSRPASSPAGPSHPEGAEVGSATEPSADATARTTTELDGALAELERQNALLDLERTDKEGVVRDNARLVASLQSLEERLLQETERVAGLEATVVRIKQAPKLPAAPVGIGMGGDVSTSLLQLAEAIVKEAERAPADLQKAAQTAVELARRDPPSAVTKARVVVEEMVKREWARVFGADEYPQGKLFGDYARELDGQRGVDTRILAVKRTLHRLASPGAHELNSISLRRACLIILVMASVLGADEPKSGRE